MCKSGLISTDKTQALLTNVMGVQIHRSIGGTIFDYGDIYIDVVGNWDIDTSAIKNPNKLKAYIQSLLNNVNMKNIQQFIMN